MSYAHYVTSFDETWLWHLIYGHFSFKGLNELKRGSMVLGLHEIDVQQNSCESYILAKHERNHFPLELVHSDLCGPMQTQSIGGSFLFFDFY